MKKLYEIFVPTTYGHNKKFIKIEKHKQWDKKIRKITGGLTICAVARGQWVNPENGELFEERIIPVRIMATEKQIREILHFTKYHYCQKAIMFYKVTDKVAIYI